ncbi:hypothetical protein [Spelaeicoccus albus]|uniref:Uncharacterized protein n=1 Tax=Spelaeicoccus albus TaxID=1280376 RepID=A0A7Z0IHJ2_9MICO|nr:hypothetical protein [Spelaeicoccus albus]NYI67788.1 hypothetical protein [Spelaeicoccus albus]
MQEGVPHTRPAPGTKTTAIYGTTTNADGWIHNTYFSALTHAKHTGKTIHDKTSHAPPGGS